MGPSGPSVGKGGLEPSAGREPLEPSAEKEEWGLPAVEEQLGPLAAQEASVSVVHRYRLPRRRSTRRIEHRRRYLPGRPKSFRLRCRRLTGVEGYHIQLSVVRYVSPYPVSSEE